MTCIVVSAELTSHTIFGAIRKPSRIAHEIINPTPSRLRGMGVDVSKTLFYEILSLIIVESDLEYDIFLMADLITGLCMNSKYIFPVYEFSEKLCSKYNGKHHKGYFNTLFYFEDKKALQVFLEILKNNRINIREPK